MVHYFRILLGRDKNRWGKWSLFLISLCAPDKVQYQSLNVTLTSKVLYYPLLFLFNYNMALLGVISPFIVVPSNRHPKVWYHSYRNILENQGFDVGGSLYTAMQRLSIVTITSKWNVRANYPQMIKALCFKISWKIETHVDGCYAVTAHHQGTN